MHQTEERDIRKMGGLASKMPFSTVSGMIAALSIAGAPPLACFVSEFFIFIGAFQSHQRQLKLILHYTHSLNANSNSVLACLFAKIHLKSLPWNSTGEVLEDAHSAHGATTPAEHVEEHGHKIVDVPTWMKVSLAILVVLVVIIGIYPTFFMNLIQTVTFGGALPA